MAHPNMFNNERQASLYPSSFVDPRISFSNDFADTQQHSTKHDQIRYKEAPVSLDFEFSVKNHAMIPADEIFFEGLLLPLKEDCCTRKVTLREKLSVDDDDGDDGDMFSGSLSRNHMSKGSCWWKERLGLQSKQEHKKIGVFAYDRQGIVSNKTQNCLAKILERDG